MFEIGNVIFLGAVFSVLTVITMSLAIAFFRGARDLKPERAEAIRWHTDFSELPSADRRCRHELTGEIARRQCPNEFDCRHCAKHPEFVRSEPGLMSEIEMQTVIAGMPVPLDRLYHRGHTWAKKEEDGTFTVGLDEFASRLLGPDAELKMPEPGAPVFANGLAFKAVTSDDEYRILSPVTGKVIAREGNRLRIQPEPQFKTDHLLCGCEVKAWMTKELERLEIALGGVPALADGGELVADIGREYPNITDARARMLLNT
jgi:glycine cleavage system H lipoate-binding protein